MTTTDEKNQQGKKAYLYEQDDVAYTTISQVGGEACGGCRWFGEYPSDYCQLVQSFPLPIRETGWCNQFETIPEPQPDFMEVLEAIAESIGGKEHKPTLIERLKELVLGKKENKFTGGFKSLGNGKWVGVWSNNFEDREGEYFPNHATDAYIARLDSKEIPMPELVFWHTHYAYGRAKSVVRIAASGEDLATAPSISIAVGDYFDDPISKAFEQATLKSNKSYKMSHGYMYPDNALIDGVYHYYDTFEISVLPDYAAANPYTLFGDETMPIVTPEKQKELEALLGKEYAAEVVTKAEQRAKELADKGIGYKDKTIPTVDSEAREGIARVETAITSLTDSIKSLVDGLKAKKDPEQEEKDDKMDKLYGARKKEFDDAVAAARKELETQFDAKLKEMEKSFNELTPRRASRDKATQLSDDDATVLEIKAANEQAEQGRKEFNQLFGGVFNVGASANGNGG